VSYRGLVLFDIDGTLMRRAGPHHRQALVHGIRKVTGLETTTDGIPVQGMLDPAILAEMMRRAGAKRALIRQAMPEIQRAAERYYRRVCPPLEGKHCPGVPALLERLARHGSLLRWSPAISPASAGASWSAPALPTTSAMARSARWPRAADAW
jgi:phosphoglycolate phosphatase-like HAD superfamily hydrolase